MTGGSASTGASMACRKPSSSIAQGRIRYKHVGPLTQDDLDRTILPLIAKLEK